MFTSQPHQRVLRRSRSLSPRRSFPLVIAPRRSRSLGRKPVPLGTKRLFDDAYLDNDDDQWVFDPSNDVLMDEYYSNKRQDDDQWIFDPSNDVLMDEYYSNKRPFDDSDNDSQDEIMIGVGATPLLDFQLRPVSAR